MIVFREILCLQHSNHITLCQLDSTTFNISFPIKDKTSVELDFGELDAGEDH